MSAPFCSLPVLSPQEWEELNALRIAITQAPAAVVPEKQERFASLFAKSLLGKGDHPLQ